MNYSTSEENYIKAIFHLQGAADTVTTNELAQQLSTRPASVTDMMKKLKAKKLLHYQPYRGFFLTTEGKKVAVGIVRRHRLWEYFLAEKLKFSWEEVHDVAEDLEHVASKKLTDKLDEFLGYPRFDPHGDPIPDTNGKIDAARQLCITEWPIDKPAMVAKVGDQSKEMLELLKHRQVSLGTRLEIKRKFDFDGSLEIKIQPRSSSLPGRQNPQLTTISEQLAKNIFVTGIHPASQGRVAKEKTQVLTNARQKK